MTTATTNTAATIPAGTVILDNELSAHAVRTPDGGWRSTIAGETFSDADRAAFDRIARGETDEWPASALNGDRTWYGMHAMAAMPKSARVSR